MKKNAFYLFSFFLLIGSIRANAQLNVVVENGIISIQSGSFGPPDPKKFNSIIDSLDKNLKEHPNDTTSLFYRALLLEQFNNQLAKASSYTKDPIENLTTSKEITEHAVGLNMQDIRLKVLRAQIYKDLVYRYSVSESWKFTSKQISERKVKCNTYKELANKCYDELAVIDKNNAYDYIRLKVNNNWNGH